MTTLHAHGCTLHAVVGSLPTQTPKKEDENEHPLVPGHFLPPHISLIAGFPTGLGWAYV